jgi:hypothetical protein
MPGAFVVGHRPVGWNSQQKEKNGTTARMSLRLGRGNCRWQPTVCVCGLCYIFGVII